MSNLFSKMKNQIKTGDLIAWSKPNKLTLAGFFLYLCQKITRGKYLSVGVVVNVGGRLFVTDTSPPHVRLTPLELLGDFYWVDAAVSAPQVTQLKFLVERVGEHCTYSEPLSSTLVGYFYTHFGYLDYTDIREGTPDGIVRAVVERSGNDPIKVLVDHEEMDDEL